MMAFCSSILGQQDQWFLLKCVHPLSEIQVKKAMSQIQEIAPQLTIWYNGEHSNTFGCRQENSINWNTVIAHLNALDFYIGEVTLGELHQHGTLTKTSIYYQQALYYSLYPENMPDDFIALLNLDEWQALPNSSREFFSEGENFTLVSK